MALSDDLLVGAAAIAKELGVSRPTIYRMAEAGEIPTFKLRGKIVVRRTELAAKLTSQAA